MKLDKLNKSIEDILILINRDPSLIDTTIECIEQIKSILEKKINLIKHEIMTPKQIKELKSNIDSLNKTQQIEVFKIISNSSKYSENSNGVFVNLSSMNNETLWKINDLVNYCIKNNKNFDEEQKERSVLLENVSIDTEPSDFENTKIISSSINSNIINDIELNNFDYKTELNLNVDEAKILQDEFNIYTELQLSTNKPKYSGIEARILKKCKDMDKELKVTEVNFSQNE